jgi:transposase
VFATGQGRKTDATDAHSVAQVGTRMAGLRPGGAKNNLSAAQAKAVLATVRPRDAVGKARRRVALRADR